MKVTEQVLDDGQLYRIYESIYRNMQRENDLINQRLGWAIFTSAGLFAATAILANITVNSNWEPVVMGPLFFAMAVLAFVGWRFSRLTLHGVRAAQEQHDALRAHYKKFYVIFEERMRLPRPMGERKKTDRGKFAAQRYPQYLSWVWLMALVTEVVLCCATLAYAWAHFQSESCLWLHLPALLPWPEAIACA